MSGTGVKSGKSNESGQSNQSKKSDKSDKSKKSNSSNKSHEGSKRNTSSIHSFILSFIPSSHMPLTPSNPGIMGYRLNSQYPP